MAAFLLEVGTEELPADFVDSALAQWRSRIPASLTEQYLEAAAIEFYGTPRRLAVLLKGLPDQQPDRQEEVKGPPAAAAFKDGQPTKAATGFARSRGASVEDLEVRSTDKGDFVFLSQNIPGKSAAEVLTDLVPQWIAGLEGKRFMRWGEGDLRFPRPIHWLVALLDDQVLPVKLVNGPETIESDRSSQGHRILHPDPVTIAQATEYAESLSAASVEVDLERRRKAIAAGAIAAAEKAGGQVKLFPDLLEEVINLVEWPSAVVGNFDAEFLNLPADVIITVMVTHQRYFPVLRSDADKAGSGTTAARSLLPHFITISNGDPKKAEIIAAGNERVVRARLADGQFFYQADRAKPLADYVGELESVTFQQKLGSVRKKVERLGAIAARIGQQLSVTTEQQSDIDRAALLCKADLVTQMVGEFPELQGVMGQTYARSSGEPEAVAIAIFEHYLPRGADDDLPQSLTGQVVGIADRLDTLVSIFALGMLPSGSSDPFALRRAANAIVNIIWQAELPLNLHQLLQDAIADFATAMTGSEVEVNADTLQEQLQTFFLQRLQTLLQDDRHVDYDLVNGVLGEDDPVYTERALVDLLDARDRALFLKTIRHNGDLATIYETVNRSARLAAQAGLSPTDEPLNLDTAIDTDRLQQPAEQALYQSLLELIPQAEAARAQRNYQTLLEALQQVAPTVSRFFDGEDSVLVMDPDLDIRRNRLNLLCLLRDRARILADFSKIVKP